MFLSFLFFFYEVFQKFCATRFKLIPNVEIPSSILTSLNSEQSFKHPSFDANYNKKSSSFFFHHAAKRNMGCSSIFFFFFFQIASGRRMNKLPPTFCPLERSNALVLNLSNDFFRTVLHLTFDFCFEEFLS